jgi:hypothetical protein
MFSLSLSLSCSLNFAIDILDIVLFGAEVNKMIKICIVLQVC